MCLKSQLLSKFILPEMKLPETPFFKHDGPKLELAGGIMSVLATNEEQSGGRSSFCSKRWQRMSSCETCLCNQELCEQLIEVA
jgi:hypothetical protein